MPGLAKTKLEAAAAKRRTNKSMAEAGQQEKAAAVAITVWLLGQCFPVYLAAGEAAVAEAASSL